MGEAARRRRGSERLRAAACAAVVDPPAAAQDEHAPRPYQEACPTCGRDITDRCSVAKAANGAILFFLLPVRCPRCGVIIVAVSPKPKVVPASELQGALVKPP